MKLNYFMLPLASAYWGDWIDGVFCSIDQPLIAEIYSENPAYNEGYCEDFCRTNMQGLPEDYDGMNKQFCCDYEAWSDETFNCYLYEGTKIEN